MSSAADRTAWPNGQDSTERFLTTVTGGFPSDRISARFDETDPSEQVKQMTRDLIEGAHNLT